MRWHLGGFLPLLIATCSFALNVPQFFPLDEKPPDTVFNGQSVPAMHALNGSTMDSKISKGNWFVEAYSPYCAHCRALAPKLQTLYEFYYTSDPLPASFSAGTQTLNSFSKYYDFEFAKINCIAFGTTCTKYNVTSFPVMMVFQDGKEVKRLNGDESMSEISKFIEGCLEIIRPGSRPTKGLQLPKVGAKELESSKTKENKEETTKIPSRSRGTVNAAGVSTPLDAEKFQKLVTKTLDPWFVKFYAPWCKHCQHMAPAWSAMAREMKGKLNIGEVNCDVEKRLCKDVHVRAFPTMLFFQGAERIEYDGLRGMGDLIDFAGKAAEMSSGVQDVTAAQFAEMEKTEEVIFIYFYDHATTHEDFEALERLPMHLIGHAKLVKTNDPDLVTRFSISTWPRLLVSRDGKPTVYELLSPRDLRHIETITHWMQSVWQPLVPELTATNAREILNDKYVVLGILSRERKDEFIIAKREIKNAAIEWMDKQEQALKLERQELRDAKQLRIEEAEDRNDQRALRNAKQIKINMDDIERKEVRFAWVDGVFWERWIKTTFGISVKDGEKVIINDERNRRYWDTTSTGNPIVPSRTSILETVHNVVNHPQLLTSKATGSKISHFFFKIRSAFSNHPFLSLAIVVGAALGGYMWRRSGRRRNGLLRLGGSEGLLGTTPGGKVD